MPQHVVHQHERHHGLRNGGRSDPNAGVMSAMGHDLDWLTLYVHGLPWQADTGRRLQCNAGNDVLSCGDPTQDTPCVIAQKPFGRDLVTMLCALVLYTSE